MLRPKSLETLQLLLPYIYNAPAIDFAIRSGGVGNASARDIVLSMTAFDEVDFDPETDIITVGAGLLWGEVEKKMEIIANGYAGE